MLKTVKEEAAKWSVGQVLTLISVLILSLALIVLQGTLYVAWHYIEPVIAKRTLAAAIALLLVLLTICLIAMTACS